jgi:DHA1 family tetracycline resistance protein-like MFS transporter
MSRTVTDSEQGRLQSAIRSLDGFASIFGPYLFAGIFALSIKVQRIPHMVGAAFIAAAAFELIGAVVAVRAMAHGDVCEVASPSAS